LCAEGVGRRWTLDENVRGRQIGTSVAFTLFVEAKTTTRAGERSSQHSANPAVRIAE
jgi:hypothetical protein